MACKVSEELTSGSQVAAVETVGLHYVCDSKPGIRRERRSRGFAYKLPSGEFVKDARTLERIKSLAIPPAYKDVWICTDHRGHLQATGIDARGRKQYRYHPLFREAKDETKFQRMIEFGKALPHIRERVTDDLTLRGIPKRKILAAVVYLLEKSLIRIGNPEYAKSNDSYGLTTLQNQHVSVQGSDILLEFVGKSHVRHSLKLHDAKLAKLIRKLQELPGQELFQYVDEGGNVSNVSSGDVNEYLREMSDNHFTAKDFRTWWGTLFALIEFSHLDLPGSKKAAQKEVTSVMMAVAKQLRNTPAVCRKCYVHPKIVESFLQGTLSKDLLLKGNLDPETVLIEIICS